MYVHYVLVPFNILKFSNVECLTGSAAKIFNKNDLSGFYRFMFT
jgi:hypothetical protein